jgi:hypothetical protein
MNEAPTLLDEFSEGQPQTVTALRTNVTGGKVMSRPRALGYVRVSIAELASKGYGFDVQRRAIREHLRDERARLGGHLE